MLRNITINNTTKYDDIMFISIERIKQAPDEPKHDNSYATNNIHSGSACNTIKSHIARKISKKESEEVNPLLTKELEHTVSKFQSVHCWYVENEKNII